MKTIEVVCGVIMEQGKLFIARRGKGVHENIWEFPGGKVEPKESREAAVIRELREELEIEVKVDTFLLQLVDERKDCLLHVYAYGCHRVHGDIVLHAHHEYAWVKAEELQNYTFEAADAPLLELLRNKAYD